MLMTWRPFGLALACAGMAWVASSCHKAAPGLSDSGLAGAGSGGAAQAGAPNVAGGGTVGGGAAGSADAGVSRFSVELAWRGGAKGAYSLIHDDLCDVPHVSQMATAVPELAKQNLKAAFGAIVRSCNDNNRWPDVNTLKAAGHEILNHSWSHPDMVTGSPVLSQEIGDSTRDLNAKITGQATSFFIFPYDSFNDTLIAALASAGYLGARAGKRGAFNLPTYSDELRLNFDVFGPVNSMYGKLGPCAAEKLTADAIGQTVGADDACRMYVLNQYVDDVIAAGAWGLREMHGVGDAFWEAVPTQNYIDHLAYVRSQVDAGKLWVDTPTTILKYHRARLACAPTAHDDQLSFAMTNPDCVKFAEPLDLVIDVGNGPASTLSVTQAGVAISAKSMSPNRFLLTVDPMKGNGEIVAR